MKMKLVLASLAIAGLAASSAVAAPPAGKGKPRTGDGCKPQITVVLKGTFVSASASSLSMNVTGANRWGRSYMGGPEDVALDSAKTKVRGGGMKAIADLAKLKAGDRVLVQARMCKDYYKDPAAVPALTATKVIGHPAEAKNDEQDDD